MTVDILIYLCCQNNGLVSICYRVTDRGGQGCTRHRGRRKGRPGAEIFAETNPERNDPRLIPVRFLSRPAARHDNTALKFPTILMTCSSTAPNRTTNGKHLK